MVWFIWLFSCQPECPAGFVRDAGRCLESANATEDSAAPTCEEQGLNECSGECVDLQKDPLHCLECGEECDEEQVCHDGDCAVVECVCDCECECQGCSVHSIHTTYTECSGGESCADVCSDSCATGGCGGVEEADGECATAYE